MTQRAKPRLNLRRLLWLVTLGVFGGLATTGFGFLVLVIWQDTEPSQSRVCCTTPDEWGFDYRDVQLASHGETLAGWYIPSRNGAVVILLHPGGIHRMGTIREARALAAEGFGILMYDRRAYGESTGDLNSGGWRDVEDIPAALAFLQQQVDVDPAKIGIFGASLGGQVALRAAAYHPELRAVMADGPSLCGRRDQLPYSQVPWKYKGMKMLSWIATPIFELRLGMREPEAVVDVIGRIAPRPVFLIGTSELERKVVRRYFDFAGEPKILWEIPEAGHGGGFEARPEEYRDKLVGFFEQLLE
ncbi:MAG: alpha/beta fold hydrolase [Acidobacteriota bacterium]